VLRGSLRKLPVWFAKGGGQKHPSGAATPFAVHLRFLLLDQLSFERSGADDDVPWEHE